MPCTAQSEAFNLVEDTHKLLAECPVAQLELALAAGVGYFWLCKFKQGRIADPGVTRVEKLHKYLVDLAAKNNTGEQA